MTTTKRREPYRTDTKGTVPGENLRRLWMVALEEAIVDATKGIGRTREEARTWLARVDDAPGTFAWVCAVLDLDVDAVRAAVRARAPSMAPGVSSLIG